MAVLCLLIYIIVIVRYIIFSTLVELLGKHWPHPDLPIREKFTMNLAPSSSSPCACVQDCQEPLENPSSINYHRTVNWPQINGGHRAKSNKVTENGGEQIGANTVLSDISSANLLFDCYHESTYGFSCPTGCCHERNCLNKWGEGLGVETRVGPTHPDLRTKIEFCATFRNYRNEKCIFKTGNLWNKTIGSRFVD